YAVQQYNTTGWNTSGVLKENVTVTIDGVERAISSIWVPGYLISVQLEDPLVPAGSKVSINIIGIDNSETPGSHPWLWIQTGTTGGWEMDRAINPNPIILKNPMVEQAFSFPEIADKTYGDNEFLLGDEKTDKGLTVTYTSQDTDIVSIAGNKATILKAGTAEIVASQEGDEEHLPATSITRTLTIKKAAITVTADEKSKAYGEEDPALTYKITTGALVGNDAFSGKMTRQNGET